MVGTSAHTLRVSMVLLLMGPIPLYCQRGAEHRKAPETGEPMTDVSPGDGVYPGSWGPWGPWMACSRSCGGGMQEQTRPCLPATPPGMDPHALTPGHMVSALRPPALLLHSDLTHPGQPGGLEGRQRDPRPGHRGSGHKRMDPAMHGKGRVRYVVPLQNYPGYGSGGPRALRRAPVSGPWSQTQPRGQWQSYQDRNPFFGYRSGLSQPWMSPTRASLYQPGRAYEPHQGQTPTAQPGSPGPHSRLPPSLCPGVASQHKTCNSHSCPPASRNIRELQCSSYNNRPFMGQWYKWEPFSEVQGNQKCELNCRAIGFRFYVQQSEHAVDGTPCSQDRTSVCVAGKCQSLGCDDYLGSGKAVDKCGVCGGDNSACKVVSGLFRHPLSKVGYHKIVEIPEGSTKINITEMTKSRNYLALRSHSGLSIINGNWAVDRPGRYEGAGTLFTYRRPNEISSTAGESLLAEGPTKEVLDVFMIYQQPNPGVYYEFVLPAESAIAPQTPHQTPPSNRPGGATVYDHDSEGRYPARTPESQGEHNWKLVGTTDCSASCGRGARYTVFRCVHRATHELVTDSQCNIDSKPSPQEEPCNVQPCPAFWDIGEWSECSRTCGLGTQHRQILCRQVYSNRTLNIAPARCRHLERPETAISCQLKICSEWQVRSEWTTCSVPCGVGQKSREVRCVSNLGDFVADEECNTSMRPSDSENCDMGPCAKSWFFSEWSDRCSAECGTGVQTRGVLCLTNHVSSLPLEGCGPQRPPESRVCNNGPCESGTEWFTGPWSQCSAECGPGSQQREVVCLTKSDEAFMVLPPYECSSLDRPPAQRSCNLKACGSKWYHTDWSACSKTCEGGFRVREARCLSDDAVPSESCPVQLRPEEREACNPEPCISETDENCRDKYFNCNVVVQARLCVYNYYRTACCASCLRVALRQSGHQGHT